MRIESKTDGKKAIDIKIILGESDINNYRETMIPIKITILPEWMQHPLGKLKEE